MRKEYRMLSFVERWGIAPRHHHQDVANHSYFVTLYSSVICHMLGVKLVDRVVVLDAALRHDAREAWESDIPGPAKRSLVDPAKVAAYEAKFADNMDEQYRMSMSDMNDKVYATRAMYDNGPDGFGVKDILKVADLLDEIFFLTFELNLGNNLVKDLYQREMIRLDQAAVALGGDKFAEELLTEVGVQIARIRDEGAVIPSNDEDLKK